MRSLQSITSSKVQSIGGPLPAYSCKLPCGRFIVVTSDEESKQDFFSECRKFEFVAHARYDAYRRNLPKWKDTVFPRGEPVPDHVLDIPLKTSKETSPTPEQT